MKRLIDDSLIKWKNNLDKKPLLVYGARQVGKTYSIVEFGKKYYDNIIYLNFEGNNNLKQIFEHDLYPRRILTSIEAIYGQKIMPKKTLLIFDEIQECEKALTSLKYFCEECPTYHIIAAGSLLGLAINRGHFSFPVGKVNILTMYPLNFEGFLMALNRDDLINIIKNSYQTNIPVEEAIHNKILEYYYTYIAIGGMPEVVSTYLGHNDFDYVRVAQNEIVSNYYGDMTKYTNIKESNKIIATYRSIPSQLAKENKKFQYKMIGSGARASTYESAIEWLKTAGIVYKCNKVKEGLFPLKMYEDFLSYKIYLNDIGLLASSLNINIRHIMSNMLSSDAKIGIVQNYVMQQLVSLGFEPYYWESNGKAEIDFVIQTKDGVIPIECKYANNVQAKSLGVFVSKYHPSYSIRVSTKNFGFENNIKSIPLYAVFCLKDKISCD